MNITQAVFTIVLTFQGNGVLTSAILLTASSMSLCILGLRNLSVNRSFVPRVIVNFWIELSENYIILI